MLFVVPAPAREATLAAVLAPHASPATPLHLTTPALLHGPGPAAAVWRTPASTRRSTLTELAA